MKEKGQGLEIVKKVIITLLLAVCVANIALVGYHIWQGSQSAQNVSSFAVTPYILVVLAIQLVNVFVLIKAYKEEDSKKIVLEIFIFAVLTAIAFFIPTLKETYYSIGQAAEGQPAESKYIYYYDNIYGTVIRTAEEKGANLNIVNK